MSATYSSRLFFLYATPVSASGIDVLVRKRRLLCWFVFHWILFDALYHHPPSSAVLPWIEDCSFGASTLIPAVLLLILVVSLYLFPESAHWVTGILCVWIVVCFDVLMVSCSTFCGRSYVWLIPITVIWYVVLCHPSDEPSSWALVCGFFFLYLSPPPKLHCIFSHVVGTKLVRLNTTALELVLVLSVFLLACASSHFQSYYGSRNRQHGLPNVHENRRWL